MNFRHLAKEKRSFLIFINIFDFYFQNIFNINFNVLYADLLGKILILKTFKMTQGNNLNYKKKCIGYHIVSNIIIITITMIATKVATNP